MRPVQKAVQPLTPGATNDKELAGIDRTLADDTTTELSTVFASWRLEDYARLYLTDLSQYPHVAARLPRMPPDELQRNWTGNPWAAQIRENATFVRAITAAYESASGGHIRHATVLDYGAGWGRFTRLMLGLLPAEQVIAADVSMGADLFDGLGFPQACVRVDPAPTTLPWAASIDLVFLYSVLTHLPLAAADSVMQALHPAITPKGLLVVTIRPEAYWGLVGEREPARIHRETGFSHRSITPTWGDTSMSLDFIRGHWKQWQVWGTGWHASDPVQEIIYLRPR